MTITRIASALLLSLALLAAASPVLAQAQPDISVRQEANQTLREYRVNGKLYAIKVEPKDGSAYFLVDRNGDGNFERQGSDNVDIPGWVR
ncbi:DUF2782 domain-containing protein [Halomonas sp. DP5N14-9]|uniref:DUF2782 domain-containing protein n=1 Tax=Halomonas sp. DP5N14-9 TaxID=2859075 RepID=UPI001C996D07|nr:DUF2782 domain-containing protein [Halomonas sp. DP5N14-9]MBY5940196.1 DUF2782 domain-containing protein [Halomonas sp. DP5N14-9]